MPEPGVVHYRIGNSQTWHTYRELSEDGENVHEHDGKAHIHAGGDQFHYHYPGIPPGWEPAYLEG